MCTHSCILYVYIFHVRWSTTPQLPIESCFRCCRLKKRFIMENVPKGRCCTVSTYQQLINYWHSLACLVWTLVVLSWWILMTIMANNVARSSIFLFWQEWHFTSDWLTCVSRTPMFTGITRLLVQDWPVYQETLCLMALPGFYVCDWSVSRTHMVICMTSRLMYIIVVQINYLVDYMVVLIILSVQRGFQVLYKRGWYGWFHLGGQHWFGGSVVWGGGEESAMKTVYFLWVFNQLSPPPPPSPLKRQGAQS